MTTHQIAAREQWLERAASTAGGGEGADPAQRRAGAAAAASCPGSGSTRSTDSRPMKGAPRWPTSSEGARSSSSTTSCSGPTTRRGVRPARRSRTGSTASPSTWRTTTSCFAAVSRAPLAKLQAYKRRMGWTFPVGVLARRRLQLRLQRLVHRGAAAVGRRGLQLPASSGPRARRAENGPKGFRARHPTGLSRARR